MRIRIWPAVGVSFLAFLLLAPVFAWLVSQKSGAIEAQTRKIRSSYQVADDAITAVREGLYQLALQPHAADAASARQASRQIERIRRAMVALQSMLDTEAQRRLTALQQAFEEYVQTDQQSGGQLYKVLRLAQQVDLLNQANLGLEEHRIERQQGELQTFSATAGLLLFILALAIAITSTLYLAKLERQSNSEQARAERAELELRRLSNQLVNVQEEERRTISRELHDEIGQILTGLRMELAGLTRGLPDDSFKDRLESVKRLAEEALRSVRNLALLLRPSMLDDMGLEPALRWQAREFARRSGMETSVAVKGQLADLPENVATCIYRAVQEALTNCGKHASASQAAIAVTREEDLIVVTVHDNGKGFDTKRTSTQGLGLLGMQERIRALQGRLTITSAVGSGVTLRLEVPVVDQKA